MTLLDAWYRCRCGNDRFRRASLDLARNAACGPLGEERAWVCTACWHVLWLRERDVPGRVAGPETGARVLGGRNARRLWERA